MDATLPQVPGVAWNAAVEAAALRPMVARGRRYWPLAILLGAVVLAAGAAFLYQFLDGLWVAGYNDRAFYGIYEADLVAFIGVSYGGALVSAVLRLTNQPWRAPLTRIAEATALVSLLAGGAFAIIHLGRPDRILEILLSPNFSSPIVWDFVAITTYLVATLVFLYLPLIPDLALLRDRQPATAVRRRIYGALALSWRGLPTQRRWLERGVGLLAILIIPLAVSVHSVLAWAFSMSTRPGWHSTLFAPYFVVAALYSGVALVIVVAAAFRRAYHLDAFIGQRHLLPLGKVMAVLGVLYLYLTFSDLLPGAYAHTDDEVEIVGALVEGPYAAAFWACIVGGLIVPILLIALPTRRRLGAIVLAASLAVVGLWLKRLLITLPSATAPLIGSDWGSAQFTWVPALLTIGAAAAIPFGLLVLFRFVPLLAVHEMVEAGPAAAGAEGGDPS